MAIALALLTTVLCAGMAHASRLCAVSAHAEAMPHAASARCPGHRAMPGDGRHGMPGEHGTPACCSGHASLAAIPAVKTSADAGDASQGALPGGPATTLAAARDGAPRGDARPPWHARDGAAGPRRHLVQRVLLI